VEKVVYDEHVGAMTVCRDDVTVTMATTVGRDAQLSGPHPYCHITDAQSSVNRTNVDCTRRRVLRCPRIFSLPVAYVTLRSCLQ
jgi:hypothetical protein